MPNLPATSSTSLAWQSDLAPCDPNEAVRLLGPLFRNLDSFRKFPDGPEGSRDRERGLLEKKEAMAVYVRPLKNEPAWAIEEAVQRFLDGLVPRHPSGLGKVPKCDEFAIEVRRLTSDIRASAQRAAMIKRHLEEEAQFERDEAARKDPISEENRKRLAALLKKTTESVT